MIAHATRTDATMQVDARTSISLALRLATERARPDDATANWAEVFEAARRELLAPLAWSRSGAFIRQHADRSIAEAWRRTSIAAYLRGQQQLALLRGATESLEASGVPVVVLKGLPLGERLYGDPFVRCSADIDLYVPAEQRHRAAEVLRTLGWKRTDGEPPWHEEWALRRDDAEFHLEVHSSLVSDHLAHLDVGPPASVVTSVGGVTVRAHAGDLVAPYLATHLATHQMPPLLWLVDFATLWSRFDARDRERAHFAAEASGLIRYLDWARARATCLWRAADGADEALGQLGIAADVRRDVHSIWRHLSLASSLRDRAHLVSAFLVPRRVRGSLHAFAHFTLARLRTRLASLVGASRRYAAPSRSADRTVRETTVANMRALRLERGDFVSLTRDVARAGGSLHVRAPGGSMLPTIPRGSIVRVRGVPAKGVEKGDVILALTSDGEPVMHRVVAFANEGLVMRGDAALQPDPPTPMARVIGVATHVIRRGRPRAISKRRPLSLGVSALKLRRRLARVVRRAR